MSFRFVCFYGFHLNKFTRCLFYVFFFAFFYSTILENKKIWVQRSQIYLRDGDSSLLRNNRCRLFFELIFYINKKNIHQLSLTDESNWRLKLFMLTLSGTKAKILTSLIVRWVKNSFHALSTRHLHNQSNENKESVYKSLEIEVNETVAQVIWRYFKFYHQCVKKCFFFVSFHAREDFNFGCRTVLIFFFKHLIREKYINRERLAWVFYECWNLT